MDLPFILNGIRERLPGNIRFRILKQCITLYKREPHIAFYKNQIRLNVRAYFCLKPHYGALLYKRASIPPQLYHITERANLSSILSKGVRNKKSGIVFLTDLPSCTIVFGKRKVLTDPVILQIDTERLIKTDTVIFVNQKSSHFYAAEYIPATCLFPIQEERTGQ